jgi:TatD DNase family protein
MHYLDVHAHLTHEKFASDLPQTIARADAAGLSAVIVNGLEPESNRRILDLASNSKIIKAALGIYPIDAVANVLKKALPFDVKKFDVDAEVEFIRTNALAGKLTAIGECGLDGYWVEEDVFAEQERVFSRLIEVAIEADLPLIIHTRKREQRSVDMLLHHKVKKVNFHCFGGKVNLAKKCAEEHGWWFSIPANAPTNEAFTKMLKTLPKEKLLTETDCPFLSPDKGRRSEPADVVTTIAHFAKLRDWSVEVAREQVWNNYMSLFGGQKTRS